MPAEVETMAYAKFSDRDVPWHGLGKPVDHLMTAHECITEADLDWGVEKREIFIKSTSPNYPANTYCLVDDRFAVVRDTDEKALGIVGGDYKVFQNRQAFEFFDNLVDSGEAKYDTAGALHGGKRIWLTAKVPQNIEVAGGDEHELYILLSTSHDGSLAIRGDVTPIRVVCTNTQQLAFARAKMTWSVTHREGIEGKVAEAREALKLTFKGVDSFKALADRMASVKVTDDEFKAIMEKAFPAQKYQLEKNLAAVVANRNESQTIFDEMRPNGWGAYNSLTEWLDHGKTYRSGEARMKSLTGGYAQVIRSRVASGILELAGK